MQKQLYGMCEAHTGFDTLYHHVVEGLTLDEMLKNSTYQKAHYGENSLVHIEI